MKVNVKYEASENNRNGSYDVVQDLGFSIKEWKSMSEDEKNIALMDAINEQPYWAVDRVEEIEEDGDNNDES